MTKRKAPGATTEPVKHAKDGQARREAIRADDALDNVREGYGVVPEGGSQNDRTAGNQSGPGSQGGARDMTSGKRSGNQ